jgi:hypothetical protein
VGGVVILDASLAVKWLVVMLLCTFLLVASHDFKTLLVKTNSDMH